MNEQQMIEEIKQIVNDRYQSYKCGWTEQRSEGNYMDVFSDGCNCGESSILYEIGYILGMELEEPEEPEYDD